MATTPDKKKTTKAAAPKTKSRAKKIKTTKPAKKATSPRAGGTKKTKAAKSKTDNTVISAGMNEALRAEASGAPLSPRRVSPEDEVKRIRESAARLGIELDEQEALQWLAQMAVQDATEVTVDTKNQVYGARIAIMDFSTQDLEYFRAVGNIVAVPDQPGVVETALALSGSAAQSKIQKNPGDADYFQRVNIKAETRDAAVKILADLMRAKGLETRNGPNYHLLAVKFGTHTHAATRNGKPIKKGSPMTWYPLDLEAGAFEVELADGSKQTIHWEDGMADPGWTKFDWVVANAERGTLANASNLLDVSWEAPDGKITPLDGAVDPYFQEIYLDPTSVPVFSKIVREVSENALQKYVSDLEYEVYKYLVKQLNYGKVAKRAYNIFRLTGRHAEAAYMRELFDEPTTALYRVWSLFDTLSGAATPDSKLDRVVLLKQYDKLIEQVVISTEGERELRIVRALMRARDEALGLQPMLESFDKTFETPREDVMNLLNEYFHDLLYGFEPIAEFLEEIRNRTYDK